ncbi:MAG: family signal peptidase [Sphingomonas bacterium]|nr:family signal peptidase [Sphingomonas bacterium]
MSDTEIQGEPVATDTVVTPPKAKSETRETLVFLLKLGLAVAIFRSFFFSPFFIPSQSMLPRLYIGDYLFVSKWNYGYSRWSLPFGVPLIPGRIFGGTPARGDVVVFRGPPSATEGEHDVIKRVIGTPGDTIEMRHGQIILNGVAVPQVPIADFTIPLSPNYPASTECPAEFQKLDSGTPICRYKQLRETLPDGVSYNVLDRGENYGVGADNTDVYTVPAGTIFVMGDNRDDSGDSRFTPEGGGMGYVPLERVEGKALFTFWSTDGSASWVLPWTWFSAARWSRMGKGF